MGLTADQADALGVRINATSAPDDATTDAERKRKAAAKRSGRRAKAVGDHAERDFARACGVYARRGRARVKKRNPGAVYGRRGPRMVEKGAADFEGHVIGTGRSVYAEVKSSNTASLPLTRRDGRPTLTPEQRARLREAHEDGCMAGVCARITVQREGRQVRRWFWLRWPEWEAAERAAVRDGERGLTQARFEAHGVECDTRRMHGAPDWLDAATQAETMEVAA